MVENNTLKKIDVSQLPKATEINANDTMLIVRPNGDGTMTAMRIEGTVLKQTKVKKKVQEQYVIGRAVSPRACDQGHMVNWYVFGTIFNGSRFLVNIPIRGKVVDDVNLFDEKVYIKSEYASEDGYVEINKLNDILISSEVNYFICRFKINNNELPADYEYPLVIGIRVDKYEQDIDGIFRAVWLSWRCVPKNIKTASTHHWFEGGYRQYRPIDGDRKFIADNIRLDRESFTDVFANLRRDAIICKKMSKYNAYGEDRRIKNSEYIGYTRKLVFKRLRSYSQTGYGQTSHAKNVGGLYRAIPIYSRCKTKGRPVYFYIRLMYKKISNGNYIRIRRIEWK